MLTDWKTTLTGIVMGIATILSHFGIAIPTEWTAIIIALGAVIFGFLAKDKTKN